MRKLLAYLDHLVDAFGYASFLWPRWLRFDPLILLRELASMLRSGLPLHEALALLADSHRGKAHRRLHAVRERVEAGEPLSQALGALPRRWAPEIVVAAVAAGERAGCLPELLDGIAAEYERLHLLDRRLRTLLIYPLAVLLIATMVFEILNWKVIPVFATLNDMVGLSLPTMAQWFRQGWAWFGGIASIAVVLLLAHTLYTLRRPLRFGRTTALSRWLGWRLPVVRGLRRALLEVRFARTLRMLVDASVPLPEALDMCERVVADDRAGDAIVGAARRIEAGERPSAALRGLAFLSPAFLWFLTDTERRGDFLDVTEAMAFAAEERFLTRVEVVERLLEPVCIVVLGLLVGLPIIGIYTMLFNVITLAGYS